jgi:hypothetical protein
MELNIEKVIAEYCNEDYIRVSPDRLYRYNAKNGRYYFTRSENNDIQFYQSVTTIIDLFLRKEESLTQWKISTEDYKKIMEEKAAYGTILHILFKDLLLGNDIPLSDNFLTQTILLYTHKNQIKIDATGWNDMLRQDLLGIVQWLQDYEIVPLAIEIALTHSEGFAGSVDLVAKSKVGTIIVDLKSNRNAFYTSNIVQLEAYRELWNENYPDVKIDGVYNLGMKDYRLPIGKSVTPYRFENQSEKSELQYWRHLLMMAQISSSIDTPKNYYDIEQTVITKDTAIRDLIQEVNIIEKLQEVENER